MIGLLFATALAFEDPHGDAAACGACHDGEPTADNVSLDPASCRSCHPTADMHPVGVTPVDARIPDGWPLFEGTVTCATCHAEPGCSEGRMETAPYWRGGPAATTKQFCARCHDDADWTRTDPHHPAAARDPGDASCAACHVRLPREGDAALRVAGDGSCQGCHEDLVHAGLAEHMGELSPTGALSLVNGHIGCITCHDVHETSPVEALSSRVGEGLVDHALQNEWTGLDPAAIHWPGQAETAHPPMLARPLAGNALCAACHGGGPE